MMKDKQNIQTGNPGREKKWPLPGWPSDQDP